MSTINVKEIISVLKKEGYKVKYTSYHTKKHISEFKKMKDIYANELFFTVYSQENRVIGRCHSVTKNDEQMDIASIEKIKSYFEMYDIKNSQNLVESLEGVIATIS